MKPLSLPTTSLDALYHVHQVVSVNSIGVGPPSNTVTATTAEEGGFSAFHTIFEFLTPISAVWAAKVCPGGGSVRDGTESVLAGGNNILIAFDCLPLAFFFFFFWQVDIIS